MRISDWSSDVCSSDLKTGGLTGALALADAAAAAGLGVMTGSMISSSLSIAPALIIAARSAFVDLDGPLCLANDRPGGVGHGTAVLTPSARGYGTEEHTSDLQQLNHHSYAVLCTTHT